MTSLWLLLALLSLRKIHSGANVTRVTRSSELLLRRQKRYLTFPTGSNLVLTMSFVKAVMQKQPKGYNVIGECDVPFPLPNDTRALVNEYKPYKRQKREIFELLEDSFGRIGLNGTACLNSFICDAQEYVLATKESNSLVKGLLSSLFTIAEEDTALNAFCDERKRAEYCKVPLFSYILQSVYH